MMTTLYMLEQAMVSYKSAVLRTRSGETSGSKRSVLSSIMLLILLPSLSKPRHQRNDRDLGTISMCLHFVRNLLAIRDPMATSLSSVDVIAESKLQSDLVVELESSRILDTLLMLSSNADSNDYNAWNVVTSDCVFHIVAGTRPEELIGKALEAPSAGGPPRASRKDQSELARLLAAEAEQEREENKFQGATRHSRFNTMINFIDKDGNRRMASGQAALRKTVEQLTMEADAKGKRRAMRRKALQEKGAVATRAPWTPQATKVLSCWAEKFMRLGFESLTRSVLEDVRHERAKVGDLDQGRTRIMQLGGFFLDYFLQRRQGSQADRHALRTLANGTTASAGDVAGEKIAILSKAAVQNFVSSDDWPFTLVGQWLEPWALRMAYVRSSSSLEKKRWLEYVAAIQLWTTLFKLIDALSKSPVAEDHAAAEGILVAHFYDQAALDSAKSVLSSYTSQSFSCLRAIVSFAQIMPRMLERYAKDNENLYVQAKKQVKKGRTDQETTLAEDEREAQAIAKDAQKERKFEFQKFQSKMCSQHLADACLQYLVRWAEWSEQAHDQAYDVVQVLHRLAIKAGDLRLFFPYKRRTVLKGLQVNHLFWSFLRSEAPRVEQDVRKFIDYVLRKFDKLDEAEQARWADGMGAPKPVKVFKMPAELQVRPSRGHLDDVGIAVGLLLEREKLRLVMWVKSCLEQAVRVKEAIVDEERGDEDEGGDEESIPTSALSRFTAFALDYDGDEELQSEASTGPEVKLLCRLLGLHSDESDTHRWVWTVPADALPFELAREVELIDDFLRRPLEMFGEPFSSAVEKVRKVATRATRKVVNEHGDEEQLAIPKARGRRKDKAGADWVDDDVIEDSDEELELVARMIAQQQGRSSSSPASFRESSQTGNSTRHSSPPSSRGSPAQKSRSTAGLFFDSDDEQVDPAPSKRTLVLSDNDDEDRGQARAPGTQARKRRALLIDDDE